MTHSNVRAQSCEHVTHSVRKPWVHVVKSSVMAHSLFLVTRLHCTGFPDCRPLGPYLFPGLAFVSPLVSSQVTWTEFTCSPSLPPARPLGNWANLWEERFQPGPNTSFKHLCSSSILPHPHQTHTILHTCFPNFHNYRVICVSGSQITVILIFHFCTNQTLAAEIISPISFWTDWLPCFSVRPSKGLLLATFI